MENLNKSVAIFYGLIFAAEKIQVLEFSLKNFNLHKISKKTKVPNSTLWDFLEKCRKLENVHYCHAKKVGRPKKTKRDENYIYLIAKKLHFAMSQELRKEIEPALYLSASKFDQFWSRKDRARVSAENPKFRTSTKNNAKNGAKIFEKNHKIFDKMWFFQTKPSLNYTPVPRFMRDDPQICVIIPIIPLQLQNLEEKG